MIDEILSELGLVLHISVATRICGHCDSLLDLMLSNIKNIAESGCIDYSLSDHFPVYLIKRRMVDKRVMRWIYRRSLKNYDFDYLDHVLVSFNWNTLFSNESDIDHIWNLIRLKLTDFDNSFCPYKWMRVRLDKPLWYNSYIQELATSRDRLFRNYRRGGKVNESLYRSAVLKRREFIKACTSAKNSYFREQLNLNKKNQVLFWKTIDELMGSRTKATIGRVFRYGTDDLLSLSESIGAINTFFAEIGNKIANEIPDMEHKPLGSEVEHLSFDNFRMMTVNDFLDIQGDLKCSKSSGIDGLCSKLIIDIMYSMPYVFVRLCNLSLSTGVFPAEFKVARLTIIPKKGDLRRLDNFRPISILNIVGKILEKFVKEQLVH